MPSSSPAPSAGVPGGAGAGIGAAPKPSQDGKGNTAGAAMCKFWTCCRCGTDTNSSYLTDCENNECQHTRCKGCEPSREPE